MNIEDITPDIAALIEIPDSPSIALTSALGRSATVKSESKSGCFNYSGNNPGIHRDAKEAGKFRSKGDRVDLENNTP